MELTPKVFRDVQFREKLRGGYHPEDVDEFLEQAAVAVEAMQAQLRQAIEQAQRAEQAATDASSSDDALRRMLVLAQRTADQAVTEARQEADKVLSDAKAKSDFLIAEAERKARSAYEQGLIESRDNMARAEEATRQAQQEVDALRGWVELHRTRLIAVLRDAQSLIEQTGLLSEPPGPGAAASGPVARTGRDEPEISLRDAAGAGAEAVEQSGAEPALSAEATGEWGHQYLDALSGEEAGSDPAEGADAEVPTGRSTLASLAASDNEATMAGGRGDATMAFDERALDSFFNDRDLGEARGLGRFRRRQ